jgi:hypothetical protein
MQVIKVEMQLDPHELNMVNEFNDSGFEQVFHLIEGWNKFLNKIQKQLNNYFGLQRVGS